MRKYFTENNALTVVVALFSLFMMGKAVQKASFWEAIAFALAFSLAVEVICHRSKEKRS